MNGEAGKGDQYRKVNKKKYDRNYLRLYGDMCPICNGHGEVVLELGPAKECSNCGGLGYIERNRL